MKKFALILMVIAALAAPASALASDGYTNVPGVSGTAGGPTSSPTSPGTEAATASSGEPSGTSVLPFTGAQLAAMLGVGVVLLGTGLVLRRARTH